VIITIIIVYSSNDFTARYLLIVVCAVIVLLHIMIKPYNNGILNISDGIILFLLVLATVLLFVEFIESNLAIQVTLVLLVLPLIILTVLYLLLYKDAIKRFVVHNLWKNKTDDPPNNIELQTSNRNFDSIIDDSKRKNATICDV